MQVIINLILVLLMMLVAGCSGQKIQQGMYQGVYDSSRIENMRGSTPAENAGKPDINYEQYRQQRQEILKRDSQ